MPAPKSVDVLRAALAALPHSLYTASRDGLGPLHEKVCDVVDELKAAGMKPEHVILTVKGIAFEAMMGPLAPVLVENLVRWCLEQYFKQPAAS